MLHGSCVAAQVSTFIRKTDCLLTILLSFLFEGSFEMSNKIKVGDKAPDFTLPDTNLEHRSLRDFLGHNVVLAFFY